jgi:hypothetical protein
MKYAVFCLLKSASRAVGNPCLDPLDYGIGEEPFPELLLRRGRVGLFSTQQEANDALDDTLKACEGKPFLDKFKFLVLECREAEFLT